MTAKEKKSTGLTAKAEEATGAFDPAALEGGVDRGGKAYFNDLLGGDHAAAEKKQDKYFNGMIILIVPSVIFVLLNACCCLWCTCLHTCCKVCSDSCNFLKCRPQTTQAYTRQEDATPLIVWIFFSLLMFAFAIAGIVQGVYKLNDSVVNSVCLVDDVHLRFVQLLGNVAAPIPKIKSDLLAASTGLKDAAEPDPQLSQNIKDIAPIFDLLRDQAKANKVGSATCAAGWDKIIASCTQAAADTKASGEEVDKALKDVQNVRHDGILLLRGVCLLFWVGSVCGLLCALELTILLFCFF